MPPTLSRANFRYSWNRDFVFIGFLLFNAKRKALKLVSAKPIDTSSNALFYPAAKLLYLIEPSLTKKAKTVKVFLQNVKFQRTAAKNS